MGGLPVGIWRQAHARYPMHAPFAPPERYPELRYEGETDPENAVYASVRELFLMMGFDAERYGTADWNPLGWLVKPGETVFLKPNMIAHRHRLRDEWDYVITHGSVIRAVADYVVIALRREGRLIIGDAPQTDSLWDGLVERMGLTEIKAHYDALGVPMELLDLRDEHHVDQDGIYVATQHLPGDPRGGVAVDLARDSMFTELDGQGKQYYGAYYDVNETNEHQRDGRHEYFVSRSPVTADVFINVPKLKTHKKCGLTVNLKSLVGINANKNWLPHYIFGAPENGGDQFDVLTLKTRLENAIVRPAKQLLLKQVGPFQALARRTKRIGYDVFGDTEAVVRSGNWHGNDTVWRMSLDLNRILMYADGEGAMREDGPMKRYFSVVDGIAGMEGNGPVAGTRRESGVLMAGANPVAVDTVCARLMGLDPARLPIIHRAWGPNRYPLVEGTEADIAPRSNVAHWNRPLHEWRSEQSMRFKPHFGWTGRIEWDGDGAAGD
jgi:uncharacterized protein (DUF362 family)